MIMVASCFESVTQSVDGTTATWTYDNIYRLTGQTKPTQVATYTMDPVGNLLVMWEGGAAPKTMTYDATSRITTMAEGANLTTYTYTSYNALESETQGERITSYSYNGQDQLILVTPPNNRKSTYTFDGDGMRRTAQEGNVLPTTMVWEGSDYLQIVGPSTAQTVLTVESEILASGSKDLLTDPLGSLVKEVSSGASLGSLIENYPYGKAVSGTGTPTTPWVYIGASGYCRDAADRDYVRARELYKTLGRWMQVDPLWPKKVSSPYRYPKPNNTVDPSGLQAIPWPFCLSCDSFPGGPCAWAQTFLLGKSVWDVLAADTLRDSCCNMTFYCNLTKNQPDSFYEKICESRFGVNWKSDCEKKQSGQRN